MDLHCTMNCAFGVHSHEISVDGISIGFNDCLLILFSVFCHNVFTKYLMLFRQVGLYNGIIMPWLNLQVIWGLMCTLPLLTQWVTHRMVARVVTSQHQPVAILRLVQQHSRYVTTFLSQEFSNWVVGIFCNLFIYRCSACYSYFNRTELADVYLRSESVYTVPCPVYEV